MGSKTQVIGSLLTTIEISVDSLLLVLADGIPMRDQAHYKQQMDRISKSLDKLGLIINSNTNYGTLTSQLDGIKAKHNLLTLQTTYKRIA